MSPYHVQIDSLHFHIMKGSLSKGRQISLLPFQLKKHKRHDLKKIHSSNMMGAGGLFENILNEFHFLSYSVR